MKILITPPDNSTYARYFTESVISRLKELGDVERNYLDRSFTAAELKEAISDTDILITHWGTPRIDADVLENAPGLRLVAHAAGSVAGIASKELYERNISVLSANPVMAQYVAESVLGYMIAGTHRFVQTDSILRSGGWEKLLAARNCTLLQPHTAAITASYEMTDAVIDDIERFINGEELQLAVSYRQFRLMTQE